MVKIKSKNQSGGITAQNVNTSNGNFNINSPQKKSGKKFWKIIITIIFVLAAIVAILEYFKINLI